MDKKIVVLKSTFHIFIRIYIRFPFYYFFLLLFLSVIFQGLSDLLIRRIRISPKSPDQHKLIQSTIFSPNPRVSNWTVWILINFFQTGALNKIAHSSAKSRNTRNSLPKGASTSPHHFFPKMQPKPLPISLLSSTSPPLLPKQKK